MLRSLLEFLFIVFARFDGGKILGFFLQSLSLEYLDYITSPAASGSYLLFSSQLHWLQ